MTGLSVLDISLNSIIGGMKGEIPPGISALHDLRSLFLHGNYLDGGIPNLRGLKKLQTLLLADNSFSGPFPKELGELTSLVTLDLSLNSFNGTIPTLPNLSELVYLNLDNNNFTEFETDWFLGANFTLCQFSVSHNHIGGMIPSSITKLLKLMLLTMSGNRLSGAIPVGFSRLLGNRGSLDLSQNQLTGEIPADMLVPQSGPLSRITCSSVNLSRNLLTGSIPPPIDENENSCFQEVDFSYNHLPGPFPWTVLGKITSLWLQNNQLSGDVVDGIFHNSGRTGSLMLVYVQDNLFTGDLSRIVNMNRDISLDHLRYPGLLDLSNNDLRWTTSEVIPDPIQATLEILGSSRYGLLRFRAGENNFSRTSLPTTCFSSNSSDLLDVLDLSNSHLHGEIMSAAFNNSCLRVPKVLNLSNNHITGPVPESIVTIPSLNVLDVSNNHLSGPIPTLPFNSSLIDPGFFDGNDGLCGSPLNNACPLPGSSVQWWVLLVSIGGSMIVALISCLAATWRWRVYRRLHQRDADLIKTLLERDAASLMPLRELRKATDNFAEKAQIGQGGFGTVYMGKLNDGTTVAIKRSKREGSDKDKEQFLNEVRILSHVNHRNLVKLIGCCMENKIAVLVFEFVSNGTLQEHLHGKIGPVRLTWKQRLNIAVQTADALNYLHSAATFPIFHRDVKSANILLNDDLNAKVADFGISRLAPLQATHVSTVAVQGTLGYMDPEYYTSYQLTDKSDVYSFGVVLLELISAKPALDFLRGGDETSLVNFAVPYIERGNLEGLIDPAIMEMYSDSAGHGRESILNVGRLTMACADIRSKARPSMNEVLKQLQNLWLNFQGTSSNVDFIRTDDDNNGLRDHVILLSESFCGDSSSFAIDESSSFTNDDSSSFTIDAEASEIQLSQFSRPSSFK